MDDIPDDKAASETVGPPANDKPDKTTKPGQGGLREVHPEGETRNDQG